MPRLRQCAKHGLPDELRCDVWKYLLGVCNPDKSEVAPNEKQLNDEFTDVIGSISSETLFQRASLALGRLVRFSPRASAVISKRAESTRRVTVAALATSMMPPAPEHDIGCVALASGAAAGAYRSVSAQLVTAGSFPLRNGQGGRGVLLPESAAAAVQRRLPPRAHGAALRALRVIVPLAVAAAVRASAATVRGLGGVAAVLAAVFAQRGAAAVLFAAVMGFLFLRR